MSRVLVASALVLSLVSLGHVARADTRAETADKMFREAKKAMDASDYPRACPLFEESQRLDPGGGTLLNLALCLEKLGKVASARKSYEEAAARARADGRADRLGEAHAHLAALAPRVPTLTLATGKSASTLGRVTLDGRVLQTEELNTRIPLDPGPHSVKVEHEGAATTTLAAELKEGENVRLSLDGDGSEVLPATTTPTPTPTPTPTDPPPAHPTHEWRPPPPALEVPAHPPESSFSAASWTAFGVAAAGGGTALVSGLMALSARSEYSESCFDDRGYCVDPTARASGARAGSRLGEHGVSRGGCGRVVDWPLAAAQIPRHGRPPRRWSLPPRRVLNLRDRRKKSLPQKKIGTRP